MSRSEYEGYLQDGVINPELREAFEAYGYDVEEDAELFKVFGGWFISEYGKKKYRIELGKEELDIYEKLDSCRNCGQELNEFSQQKSDDQFLKYEKQSQQRPQRDKQSQQPYEESTKQSRERFDIKDAAEYGGRKALAIVMAIIGLAVFVSGPLFFTDQPGPLFILVIIGLGLILYANHYRKKVTVILWTRQAMREYGCPSTKDAGFREGFNIEDAAEYGARKLKAIGIGAAGIISLVIGLLIAVAEGPFGLGIFLIFIIPPILLLYAAHYWGKVTFIMWRRQAMREYGCPTTEDAGYSEGFKIGDAGEYGGRKAKAAGIIILGFFITIIMAIATGPLFIIGVIIVAYGAHYWDKVNFIMWTRQALREYGCPSYPDAGYKDGFKVKDAGEFLGRKVLSILIGIGGLGVGIFGFYRAVVQESITPLLLWSIIAGAIIFYGVHYWKKVGHVIWTRQALREYGCPSIVEDEEMGDMGFTDSSEHEEKPAYQRTHLPSTKDVESNEMIPETEGTENKDSRDRERAVKDNGAQIWEERPSYKHKLRILFLVIVGGIVGIILVGPIITFLSLVVVGIVWFVITRRSSEAKKIKEYNYPKPVSKQNQKEQKQQQQEPNTCSYCGQPIRYIEKYENWYCDNCQEYRVLESHSQQHRQQEPFGQQEEESTGERNQRQQRQIQEVQTEDQQSYSNTCPDCGCRMRYIEEYERWYCDSCQEYK